MGLPRKSEFPDIKSKDLSRKSKFSYRNQCICREILSVSIENQWICIKCIQKSNGINRCSFHFLLPNFEENFNTKLLTNIQLEDGHYIFETYSIINQKEEIKISEIELTQLKYKIGSIFTSHNLTLKCKGNKGIRSKKLYINAEQSSELLSMLVQIKKTIADKKQQ